MKKLIIIACTLILVLSNLAGAFGAEAENNVRGNDYPPVDWSKQKDTRRNVSYNMQSYSTSEPPQVTVSNHLLRVGQDNQVTITIKQNKVAPVTGAASASAGQIRLNKVPYYLNDTSTILVNPGQHTIDELGITYGGHWLLF